MQYASVDFKRFSEEYGFIHRTSSQYFPQSNGKAEKGVQIVKRIILKCQESNQDVFKALMKYRSTPLQCGKSPALLLFGRDLRTDIPQIKLNTDRQNIHIERLKQMKQQRQNYNKNAKDLISLRQGDVVRFSYPIGGRWNTKARVIKEVMPRSYEIITENGVTYRRNRRDLLKTQEKFKPVVEEKERESVIKIMSDKKEAIKQQEVRGPNVEQAHELKVRKSNRQAKPKQRLIETM
jgi:hypothetical protein